MFNDLISYVMNACTENEFVIELIMQTLVRVCDEESVRNRIPLFDLLSNLIAPIIEKMQNAIDSVAAEGGYQYIFDASPGNGILLYAEQNLDVTPMVMAKMGISMPTEEPAAEK